MCYSLVYYCVNVACKIRIKIIVAIISIIILLSLSEMYMQNFLRD